MDGGRVVMDGALMVGALDEVCVVASSFDHSRVCSVASWWVLFPGYLGECLGGHVGVVFRGESPTVV